MKIEKCVFTILKINVVQYKGRNDGGWWSMVFKS